LPCNTDYLIAQPMAIRYHCSICFHWCTMTNNSLQGKIQWAINIKQESGNHGRSGGVKKQLPLIHSEVLWVDYISALTDRQGWVWQLPVISWMWRRKSWKSAGPWAHVLFTLLGECCSKEGCFTAAVLLKLYIWV